MRRFWAYFGGLDPMGASYCENPCLDRNRDFQVCCSSSASFGCFDGGIAPIQLYGCCEKILGLLWWIGPDLSGLRARTLSEPCLLWGITRAKFQVALPMVLWCCFGDKSFFTLNPEERRQRSDEIYRRRILEQRRRQEEAQKETPAQRTRRLLRSFTKHEVQMVSVCGPGEEFEKEILVVLCLSVCSSGSLFSFIRLQTVKAEDLVDEDPYDTVKLESDNSVVDDIETGSMEDCGQLKLANGTLVPNCCAICLTGYEVGDTVIWSSNKQCAHAFHQDCVVGWLVKMQPETPCPCCRQEFTDLEDLRKERKVKWSANNAFDVGAVSLR